VSRESYRSICSRKVDDTEYARWSLTLTKYITCIHNLYLPLKFLRDTLVDTTYLYKMHSKIIFVIRYFTIMLSGLFRSITLHAELLRERNI
jgi:hypothetical protein